MTHWAVKYIGLPYLSGGRDERGLDCWGLLRLVYRQERGVLLPALPGVAGAGLLHIAGTIAENASWSWQEVGAPKDGDAVAMSLREALHHVGVWIEADGGRVIHSWKDLSVVADTLKMLRFKGIRTIRFFRYGLHH